MTILKKIQFKLLSLKKNVFSVKLKPSFYMGGIILLHDAVISFFSLFLSLYLRVGEDFLDYSSIFLLKNMSVFVLLVLGVFLILQPHKTIWKFTATEDLWKLGSGVILSNILYYPILLLLSDDEAFPIFVPFLNMFVMIALLMLPRLIVRLIHDHTVLQEKKKNAAMSIPILLIGDGDATELFIREARHTPSLAYDPIGILTKNDDDQEGQMIYDVPILGMIKDIDAILETLKKENKLPRHIIVTDQSFNEKENKHFIKNVHKNGLVILKVMQQFSFNVILSEQEAS